MISSIPSTGSILSNGVNGMRGGIDRAAAAANHIAYAAAQGGDQLPREFSDSLVALKQGETQVAASAAVVKTADTVLGALIDIRV